MMTFDDLESSNRREFASKRHGHVQPTKRSMVPFCIHRKQPRHSGFARLEFVRILLYCSDDHASPLSTSVLKVLSITQNPHVWRFPSWFQTNPTKLNPLPLMLHKFPPGLSGTDGSLNLHENASKLPVRMREISSGENSDIRGCAPREPIVRPFWDVVPQGRQQRQHNQGMARGFAR
jgi:hypothetical protein